MGIEGERTSREWGTEKRRTLRQDSISETTVKDLSRGIWWSGLQEGFFEDLHLQVVDTDVDACHAFGAVLFYQSDGPQVVRCFSGASLSKAIYVIYVCTCTSPNPLALGRGRGPASAPRNSELDLPLQND